MGKVVARYGREDYIAVDVRLADGQHRMFWPRDLEEISPLERVMNLGKNRIEMRTTGTSRKPSWPWNPHFYAVTNRVHNTL